MEKDTTDQKNKSEETPVEDPKLKSMLKALGYYADPAEQEKLPEERESETEADDKTDETEHESAEESDKEESADDKADESGADETVTDTDSTSTDGDGKANESTEDAETESKGVKSDAAAKQEKADDESKAKRARKIKPGDALKDDEQRSPSTSDIKAAVREAIAETSTKKESEAEKKTDTTGFHPLEIKALETAEMASKAMPDKYKDMPAKELSWIRKNREFIAEYVKENGQFDHRDPKYAEFVQANRPQYQAGDKEELFLIQAEERATKRIRKELDPEIAARDRQIAELRFTPVITRVVNAVQTDVLGAAGDGIAKLYAESPEKIAEEFPVEAPIVASTIADVTHLSNEYLRLAKGVATYNPDDQAHDRIVKFIQKQGREVDAYADSGKAFKREDGKVVISRELMGQKIEKGEDVSKFSTFTDQDIINMISHAAKTTMAQRIKQELDRFTKVAERVTKKSEAASGDKKQQSESAKKEEKKPTPPKGGTTKSPGAKSGAATPKDTPAFMKALGLAGAKGDRNR